MKLIPSVAILGAGFAGLATGYFLSQKLKCQITFYDPLGPGGSASSISAGMLHKYGGLHAKKSPFADEGKQATLELLDVAQDQLKKSPLLAKGILRLAFSEKQMTSYKKCADIYPDVEWVLKEDCKQFYPHIPARPAIFIPKGLVIDAKAYLEGLFQAIPQVNFKFQHADPQEILSQYDLVIYTMGPKTPFAKTSAVKGQLIEIQWPSQLPHLRIGLVSQVYICLNQLQNRAYIGATFEHEFKDELPDKEKALKQLMPKAFELLPALKGAKIISVKSALRASTPDHLPVFGKISPKEWYFCGLGSKGLLYHALFAKKLVDLIVS